MNDFRWDFFRRFRFLIECPSPWGWDALAATTPLEIFESGEDAGGGEEEGREFGGRQSVRGREGGSRARAGGESGRRGERERRAEGQRGEERGRKERRKR